MDLWKKIDLSILKKVPLAGLIPGNRYIMHSTTRFFPNSRRLVVFKRQNGAHHVLVDVTDSVFFKPRSFQRIDEAITFGYMGNNRTIQASGYDFYEYPEDIEDILLLDKRKEVSQSIRSHIPSLDRLSRNAAAIHNNMDYDELNTIVPLSYSIQQPTISTGNNRGGQTKRKRSKRTKSRRKKNK
jgi:hypothetical protein